MVNLRNVLDLQQVTSLSTAHPYTSPKAGPQRRGVSNQAKLVGREQHHALEPFPSGNLRLFEPRRGRIAHAHQGATLRSWGAQRVSEINGLLALHESALEREPGTLRVQTG